MVHRLTFQSNGNRVGFRAASDLLIAQTNHGESQVEVPFTALNRPLKVSIANIDDEFSVRIDGRDPFEAQYLVWDHVTHAPTSDDLAPVRLVSRLADVEVSNLVLSRDIYYTLRPARSDYESLRRNGPEDAAAMQEIMSNPIGFDRLAPTGEAAFPIPPGHYFMLGDNSAWSSDARVWETPSWERVGRGQPKRPPWAVPEGMIIGKAFFVYWPHGVPFWPELPLGRDLRVPFRPNFERMTWIR